MYPSANFSKRAAVVSTEWYANQLGDNVRHVTIGRFGIGTLSFKAHSRERILTKAHYKTLVILLLVEIVFHRKRVILIEFIRREPRNLLEKAHEKLFAFLARRTVLFYHVLTHMEAKLYADRYKLDQKHFKVAHWPMRDFQAKRPVFKRPTGQRILASGRAACDWKMLFDSCHEQPGWDLTIVCSKNDLTYINALNVGKRVNVLSEIPQTYHDQLMREANLYVLPLREDLLSSGQIRLMKAISAGTPVIATSVKALDDYSLDSTLAKFVPPEDFRALRTAVNRILLDPQEAERRAEAAWEASENLDFTAYLSRLICELEL